MASRLTSLYGSHSSSSPPLSRANSCITAASRPSAATVFALDAAESGGTEASTGRPTPPSTGRATPRGSAGRSTIGWASSFSPPRACSSPPPPSPMFAGAGCSNTAPRRTGRRQGDQLRALPDRGPFLRLHHQQRDHHQLGRRRGGLLCYTLVVKYYLLYVQSTSI